MEQKPPPSEALGWIPEAARVQEPGGRGASQWGGGPSRADAAVQWGERHKWGERHREPESRSSPPRSWAPQAASGSHGSSSSPRGGASLRAGSRHLPRAAFPAPPSPSLDGVGVLSACLPSSANRESCAATSGPVPSPLLCVPEGEKLAPAEAPQPGRARSSPLGTPRPERLRRRLLLGPAESGTHQSGGGGGGGNASLIKGLQAQCLLLLCLPARSQQYWRVGGGGGARLGHQLRIPKFLELKG